MKNNPEIILVCKSVIFYCLKDEDAFFEWIKKIPSIVKFDGVHDELYLYIKSKKIPDNDLRDLLALFYRYKIDMKQLAMFLNEHNKDWFYGRPKGYWFNKVFGSDNK